MGWTGPLPDRVLQRIAPSDRAPLGKAGMTSEEAILAASIKSERELQSSMRQYLVLHGIEYIQAPFGKKSSLPDGWPDFTIFANGTTLFVEAKAPGGKLSPEQIDRHSSLLSSGFEVYVIDSIKDFIQLVRPRLTVALDMPTK